MLSTDTLKSNLTFGTFSDKYSAKMKQQTNSCLEVLVPLLGPKE